jgi:hypothetical protein
MRSLRQFTCIILYFSVLRLFEPKRDKNVAFPNHSCKQRRLQLCRQLIICFQSLVALRKSSQTNVNELKSLHDFHRWKNLLTQYNGNTEGDFMPYSECGTSTRLIYTASLERDHMADLMGSNNIVTTWKDVEKHCFPFVQTKLGRFR